MQAQTTSPRLLRVFLCHASEDKPIVEKLHKRLKRCNIDSWLDKENMFGGQNWQYQIRMAVRNADVVVICLSDKSINKVGFVHREIKLGLEVADEQPEGSIFIIPLRLQDCSVPDSLRHLQRIDYFKRDGFDGLMRSLELRRQSLNVAVAPINYKAPRKLNPTPSQTQMASPVTPATLSSTSQGIQTQQDMSRRTLVITLIGTAIGITIIGGGALTLRNELFKSSGYTPVPANRPQGTILYRYLNHTTGIRALAWSPDGQRIATAGDDHTAQVWDALTGEHSAVLYHADHVEGVSWSPDNTRIVTGCADGTAQIWNTKTRTQLFVYKGHTILDYYQKHPWVNRVSWSPDGNYIASCDQTSHPGSIATVRVWEALTGKTNVIYSNHTNGVYAVAWSPEGRRIASAGYDGTLQIWDARNGTLIAYYQNSAFLFGLSWSPNGASVAVGSADNTVKVVESTNGDVLATYQGHYNWVKDVAWSPNGRYIASASADDMVRLWNTANGENFFTFVGNNGSLDAVGWSRDGKLIASGGNPVQVWKAL